MVSQILQSPIEETTLNLFPFPIYSILLGVTLLQIAAPSTPMSSILMNFELGLSAHAQFLVLVSLGLHLLLLHDFLHLLRRLLPTSLHDLDEEGNSGGSVGSQVLVNLNLIKLQISFKNFQIILAPHISKKK